MKIRIDESDLRELLEGYKIFINHETHTVPFKHAMAEFVKKIELVIEKEKGIR